MERHEKSDWKFLVGTLALIFVLKLIGLKFPVYFFDFFTFLSVLTGIGLLVWMALKTDKLVRLSLASLSIFLFLHLVVFPFLYLIIISRNPESVEFDGYVYKTEKAKAINALNTLFRIDNLKKQISLLRLIESAPDSIRNIKLEELKKRKVSYREFIIGLKMKQPIGRFKRPNQMESLVFYNSRMTEITYILNRPEIYVGDDNTIDNYRLKFQKIYERAFRSYNLEYRAINRSHFWGYKNILPFTLNITLGGNIKCRSAGANIIYFFHYSLVWIFLIGFLSSLMTDLVKRFSKI
ncbi:hypothetical protein [Edaphocola flava]|uniref:hypothetical protein n=1 Tax=Edaphocola flava TaxID=2499629 RepID=UPI00100C1A4E|nr:hypothetical protein [Edaphocola flava]